MALAVFPISNTCAGAAAPGVFVIICFDVISRGFNTVNPQQIDPYWYQETKFYESCEQMNGNVKKKGHTD